MKVYELRNKYPEFSYKTFHFEVVPEGLNISFSFAIGDDIEFHPTILIKGVTELHLRKYSASVLKNLFFNLGMVELFSYWKATCSPKIKIDAGYLTKSQRDWWKDLLLKGMGQYFYENKIDFKGKDFVEIVPQKGTVYDRVEVEGERVLIPIGGGKDSAVTAELLSKSKNEAGAFLLNPVPAAVKIADILGIPKIEIKRVIDPVLLKLNQKGYLNGHTPFSAYLAFLSTLCAVLFGYKYIAFSNEASSNEGNVSYLGTEINHQYSKTFKFEKKFRDYNARYLSNVEYFSFLRPLYEIQISKLFSKYKKYFGIIRSCNVGQKLGTYQWCCKCPKCLSTFMLLYPYLGPKGILEVFPRNLYEDGDLVELTKDLVLPKRVKPFECVGTKEELQVALGLLDKKLDNYWNKDNFLPTAFERVLKKEVYENTG